MGEVKLPKYHGRITNITAVDDDNMDFSATLKALKDGRRLKRKGWNHPDQYVFLIKPGELTFESLNSESKNDFVPFLAIKTVQGTFVPWLASQTDLLAEDWEIVT